MKRINLYTLSFVALIGVALVLTVAPARAQQSGDTLAIEEIIVTARKREENLQDVGLSVSAFSKQEIENKFSTDVRDLVSISPNLVMDDTAQGPGGVASIYIRGIGVSEVEKNFDPAVGVVMDGIYIGTMTGGLQRTIDLERVEVLRGPQGTLFGRNTIGGVINLERSKPTMETGGMIRAGFGDYDTSVIEGIFNLALGDQVGLKLTGAYRDQGEGYYTSTCDPSFGVPLPPFLQVPNYYPPCTTNGQDAGKIEYTNYGINFLFAPSENLEIEYTYDKEETTQDTPPLINMSQTNSPSNDRSFCDNFAPGGALFCAPSLSTPTSGGRLETDQILVGPIYTFPNGPEAPLMGGGTITYPNGEPARDATFDTETHILEAHLDFADDYRMDLIIGSWETEETVLTDWDGTAEIRFHTDRPAEYEQTTAELRISSTSDGPFNWTAGAYWWDSEYEIRLVSSLGFFPPPGPQVVVRLEEFGFLAPTDLVQYTNQTSESWAVFGEADWAINDKWTLTVGGRWTEDEKTTRQAGQVPCGLPAFGGVLSPEFTALCATDLTTPITASKDWSEFTPRVGLRWAVSDDAMFYATYSGGYRSGGFNGRVDSPETASAPYDQETVDNFEIGYKSQWLDNRVRFNAAVFYMSYDDKQEEIQLPSATSGTGQKTVAVNAADATISGLEMELLFIPAEGWRIRGNLGFLDAGYDNFSFDTNPTGTPNIIDNSHLDFRRAPDFTGSVTAEYQWPVGQGQMWIGGTWHYLGEHEVDFANKPELHNDAQNLVNAAINYEIGSALFSVFGHNLLDEDGFTIGFDVASLWSYAATRAPRTYGAQVAFRFGE
jgi:iron complex outermembrane receptor protein